MGSVLIDLLLVWSIFAQIIDGQVSLPGRACGSKSCIAPEARCADRQRSICECKGQTQGDGYLSCHSAEEEVCRIVSNAKVTNFNGDPTFNMTTPCRYQMAIFDTVNTITPSITCKVRVYAHGERQNGLFFTRGFDATVIVESAGSTSEYAGYRGRGRLNGNNYEYELETRSGSNENWQVVEYIYEADVLFEVDDINQRILLEVFQCGLKIIYRAEDSGEGANQTVQPGLVVSVNKHEVDVMWLTRKESICMTPTSASGGPSASDVASTLGFSEPVKAMHYWSFTSVEKTTHCSSPKERINGELTSSCDDVKNTLSQCNDQAKRNLAMACCFFILDKQEYVQCHEGPGSNSSSLLPLFNKCLEGFCKSLSKKCQRTKNEIISKGCEAEANPVFMATDCDTV